VDEKLLLKRKKQPVFTARILNNDASLSGALKTRKNKKSRIKIAGVLIALASLLGMFLVVMGSAVTGNAQKETLNACIGGVSWYGVSPVASSSLALTSTSGGVTWQQYVIKDNVSIPSGPNLEGASRTPNEYYGSFFPFTSNYDSLGNIQGPDGGELCGMPDGYLSATIPTLIFAVGSAMSSLMIAVYGWATNPDILNGLIAPVDCIVAGAKEGGGSLSAATLQNFTDSGDTVGAANIASIYGDSSTYVCPAGQEGLVKSLYLAYFLPVVFLGALWMFWQGSVKRRAAQSLQGGLWMILIGALSIVFLYQPTFLAVKINDGVSTLNNQLLESVLGATVGGNGADNDMCYLPSTADLSKTGPVANPKMNAEQLADIGPRRASCMLWKTLIYDSWAYGQFGEISAAGTPLKTTMVEGGDADTAQTRKEMFERLKFKFPHMTEMPLGLAQIEATVLDHDEIISISAANPLSPRYQVLAEDNSVLTVNIRKCQDTTTGELVNNDFCGVVQGGQSLLNDQAYAEMNAIKDQVAFTPRSSGWSGMWAGQAASQRYSAAIVAVVGAMIGGLVITILGFVNVLYQLGMLLLILVAPLVLLVGLHPGTGRRVATKWLEALLSTATKRVLVSFLLVVLIAIYSVVYSMDVGWLQKVLLIAAVGIGILMYRKQLTQMVGAVNLGGGGADSFNGPAQQAQQKVVGGAASSGGAMVGAAIAGGGIATIAGAGVKSANSGGGSPVRSAKSGVASGQAAAQRSQAKRERERRSTTSDNRGGTSPRPSSGKPRTGNGNPQATPQATAGATNQGRPVPRPTAGGENPRQQPEQGGANKVRGGAVQAGVGAAQTAAGVASGNPVMAVKGVSDMAGGAKNISGGAADLIKEENSSGDSGTRKGPEGDNPRPKKDDDGPI
jgi:hypothetical protein